jgi:hypothetical protein
MTKTEEKAVAPKQSANVATYDDSMYEAYDDSAAEAEQDEMENEGTGGPEDRLAVGRNVRRILPPPKGSAWGPKGRPSPFRKVWEHRLEIPGAKRPLLFNCPRRMGKNRKCLVCDEAMKLDKSTNPLDKDRASGLFPSRKYLVNWVDREKEDEGVKVGKIGIKLYEQIGDLREENGDYTHPVKGFDIVIKRKGKERDTTYKAFKGSTCQLQEDAKVGTEWIADQYDLDQFSECPSEDGMDAVMEQLQKLLDEGEDRPRHRRHRREDDDRRGGRSSSRGGRRDEDDDDEDEDDEEEDREERGSRRRRSSRSAQDDAAK